MRALAQKPTAQHKESGESRCRDQTPGTRRGANSILRLRSANAQAAHGLPEADSRDAQQRASAASSFSRDFSRIPVHAGSMGNIQGNLPENTPGDVYEQEADRIADDLMRVPEMQRRFGSGDEVPEKLPWKHKPLQTRQAGQDHAGGAATPPRGARRFGSISEPVPFSERSLDGGFPLSSELRSFFEPRLGHELSSVRIHTGEAAAAAARERNALAYTTGPDVVFDTGEYRPWSEAGRRLLAHELVHVVQQDGHGAPRMVQRKPRTHWRDGHEYFYQSKAEAQDKMDHVLNLGKSDLLKILGSIEVDRAGLVKEKEGWTFYYFPLTEAEAKTKKAEAETKLGKADAFTVEFDQLAASFYIQPKCPGAVPVEAGWTAWNACFATEGEAKVQQKKLEHAHIEAKTGQLGRNQFFLLFKPLTEAEAKAKGEAEKKTRRGAAEGMFTVKTSAPPALQSSTYDIEANCPPGFKTLGKFEITSYFTAKETDFPEKPTAKDRCSKGTYRERFLHNGNDTGDKSPFGVDTEGNGLTVAGKIIHHEGKDCYKEVSEALDARGRALKIGSSVAVDTRTIPLGTQLLIEDVGLCSADDVGGKVKGNHIDVFKGLFDTKNDTTLKNKLVCQKK